MVVPWKTCEFGNAGFTASTSAENCGQCGSQPGIAEGTFASLTSAFGLVGRSAGLVYGLFWTTTSTVTCVNGPRAPITWVLRLSKVCSPRTVQASIEEYWSSSASTGRLRPDSLIRLSAF